jgi:hypothetical protein
MRIAAEILRQHPGVADDEPLLRSILKGLRTAILEERQACRAVADKFYDDETANRDEYSDIEVAVKFTLKTVSATISDDIRDRETP